jgi:hypothetical protein
MDAVKLARGHHRGLGLKDAKEMVERYLERDAATRSKFDTASSAKKRRTALSLLLILISLGLITIGTLFLAGSIG